MNSFGIFQEYYAKNQLASNSTSTIAWLGAISILFLFGISVIAGAMLDAFGPKVSLAWDALTVRLTRSRIAHGLHWIIGHGVLPHDDLSV